MMSVPNTLILLLIIEANCAPNVPTGNDTPLWQKVCAVLGIIFVMIAGLVYASRRRNIDMRDLLRGYIVPSQAENDRGTQSVIETSHTVDKQASFEDDNYLSKDEELSVDRGTEAQNRHLSSVFEQKNGSKGKKSKSRKRLANAAKISNNLNEEQNSQISQDNDL